MVKIILEKSAHLQSIMDAGRDIHEAINAIDVILAGRLGVQRNDLRCLMLLQNGPATAGEVAVKTGLTSGSVTALLDRLEAAGYVERHRSLSDRRSVEIALTACSSERLKQLKTYIEGAIRSFFDNRSAQEVAAAAEALGLFSEALGQCAIAFDGDAAAA